MLNKNMLISIIMPVYNSEKYLDEAIKSVLSQTYSEFELLLIDDGSTDNSPAICDEFETKDSRIRTIHKPNGGVCSARNLGINEAKGEYITFIDNDDVYEKNFLEVMVNQLLVKKVDFIKCGRKNTTVDLEGNHIGYRVCAWNESKVYSKDEFLKEYYRLKASGIMSSVWNGLYLKSFILENNLYFNETFRNGNEDVFFNNGCYIKCNSVAIISDVLYEHFYRNGHSTSLKYNEAQITTFIETVNLEEEFLAPIKGEDTYKLIFMRNIRLAFKYLNIAPKGELRENGIRLIEKGLPIKELENCSILKNSGLSKIEKIDIWLIKKKYYNVFFMIHGNLKKNSIQKLFLKKQKER
ncbi:MAG: glycosyltransferase family 2 protein [Acutalibacteraceae bacterium]|nr:glycosyltransferase family 2 protein [Acutalibacteraceae bacterium]